MPNNKWAQYEEKPAASKWDQYAEAPAAIPAPKPTLLKGVQDSFDTNTRTSPKEPLLETGLKSVVGAIGAPIVHPLNTIRGMAQMAPAGFGVPLNPENPISSRINQGVTDYHEGGLPYAATKIAGEGFGSLAAGEATGLLGEAARGPIRAAGSAIRDSAIGDPNVAALKGLRVGAASPKALSTLSAVEGARPFLKGVNSLEDLQARIPQAKSEIWSPYERSVSSLEGKTQGPGGDVRALENERLQSSALLRGLRSRNPEAIQLAEQKGLREADLLEQDRQLKSLLDPQLAATGIDPPAIRDMFGKVARIGQRVSGKSTIAEADQPYGFGKMVDLDLHKPLQAPGKILEGARDIVAGRPLLKGKPTDIAIREAFRNGGELPDLGRILTPEELANPFINKGRLRTSALR